MAAGAITRVGFIGLGQMGRWMARNVLRAGFELTVLDVNPQAVRVLEDEGAAKADAPQDLASRVECVLLSLPDTETVEEVVFGHQGLVHGARPGLVVVDCGTTGYLPTLELARRLADEGLHFADAPVSGMEDRARDATLSIMFGGNPELFERLRPILSAMGNHPLHLGATGNGQLAKLVNQLLFNIHCAALAEILPMAVKLGLDPQRVSEVVTTGTGRSFAAEFFIPRILENRFDQGYPLQAAYKDMISAAEISARERIPLPLVQAATTTYQLALADGHGRADKGAMIQVFERLLGVKFRRQTGENR